MAPRTETRTTARSPIRCAAAAMVAAVSLLAAAGCQVAPETRPTSGPTQPVAYMKTDELAAALTEENGLLLVEFCVPSGCLRCDQMRGSIDELASDQGDRLAVRRVNLRQHPELSWEFDVTACPSYVAFRGGKEVYRAAYPTSSDLIASRLEELLAGPPASPMAFAAQ